MTILIQGAMDAEIDVLLDYFKPEEIKTVADYNFYVTYYKNNKIVISKTGVGMINASVSTTIAVNEFHPALIINQGCAGSHLRNIKVGDLIIGEKSVYINNFRTDAKGLGEGSDSLTWRPSKHSYAVSSTEKYVKIADEVNFDGQKFVGILGSGDLFSKEADRINYLHGLFGELCEDMESVAALKVGELFNVERIALRIISNNEITLESFDLEVCKTMQKFVISFIDKII